MKKLQFFMLVFCVFTSMLWIELEIAQAGGCQVGAFYVALFSEPNYEGDCRVLFLGTYHDLKDVGFNDKAKSIFVGSEVFATICIHRNFSLEDVCEVKNESDPNLGFEGFIALSGEVSSVAVQVKTCYPASGEIVLFVHSGFGGGCLKFPIGTVYSDARDGGFNDQISSVMVRDASVMLCEHRDFGGDCEIFTYSFLNLRFSRVGTDALSSFRVF